MKNPARTPALAGGAREQRGIFLQKKLHEGSGPKPPFAIHHRRKRPACRKLSRILAFSA